MIAEYVSWIDQFEERLASDSRTSLPVSDTGEHLMVRLEVNNSSGRNLDIANKTHQLAYLKSAIVDTSLGYALLRRALPKFLQIIAITPNSFMEHASGDLVVSFSHALSGPRNELRRFVTYDTIIAFLLGAPPLAEYGYDNKYSHNLHGFEWTCGIPFALLQVMSQVNSWRAQSRVRLDDWQVLEQRVLGWEPSSTSLDETSATDCANIARAKIQEGWKHVVLIYIYMVSPLP
jgi:hypothetical protein